MSLSTPYIRSTNRSTNYSGQRTSSTAGTTVTAGGTAHTLSSSFTDLFASTTHDCFWLSLWVHNTQVSATRTDTLLNIYTGAASSEVLLIDSLAAGWSDQVDGGNTKYYGFPIYIPAGTRISMKARSVTTSKVVSVMGRITGGNQPEHWVGRAIETLGQNTASSTGTSVTPGTTSEGSFTSIGTTGFRYGYIYVMGHGFLSDTNIQSQAFSVDVGTGSAEIAGLSDFLFKSVAIESLSNSMPSGTFCDIASGTALQLRAQVSGGTAEAGDCLIYGVY